MNTTVKKKLERVTHHGGMEGVLSGVAWTVLVLGILGFLLLWVYGADSGSGWSGFLAGAAQLVSAVVVWAILKALGEIIRLQKKLVGLDYGGTISEVAEEKVYACAACGEILLSEDWCHTCDKAVEGGAPPEDE